MNCNTLPVKIKMTIQLKVLGMIDIDKLTYCHSICLLDSVDPDSDPVPMNKKFVPEQIPKVSLTMLWVVPEKTPSWTRSFSELINTSDESWIPIFTDPEMSQCIQDIDTTMQKEILKFGDWIEMAPYEQTDIFNAFKLCTFPPKCVIIGQDPNFAERHQATGLAFGVPNHMKIPQSLNNIYQEISTDLGQTFPLRDNGDLTDWAENGVLLLNTSLTVRLGQKESHHYIWSKFTTVFLRLLSKSVLTPVVYMLWGNHAKSYSTHIKNDKQLILESSHPLSANHGGWWGSRHFSKCNQFMVSHGLLPIQWN